jgi:chromosome segregation ATPase
VVVKQEAGTSPKAPAAPAQTGTVIELEHPVFQAHRRDIDLRNIKLYQEIAGSLSGPWQKLADEKLKTNVLEGKVEALSNKNKQLEDTWTAIHKQLEASSGKYKLLEETVQSLKEEREKLVEEQKGTQATIEELKKELEGVKRERDELDEDFKGMARLFEKHVKK